MNRTPSVALFGLLAASLLAGCGSPQMSRIDRNRDLYETWPIDIRQSVLDGKVEPGMTPDMVKVAWGKPTEVVGDASIGDEIWVYRKGGVEDPGMMYPGSSYPGSYPGSGYPGGMVGGPSIGISSGPGGTGLMGGTSVGLGTNVGLGSGGGLGVSPSIGMGTGMGGMGTSMGGMGGMGGMGPIYAPTSPGDVKEVVFRNGVVYRADAP